MWYYIKCRSFIGEITDLAQHKRSCLVRVHNKTSYAIKNTCIAIYGEIDNRHRGPTKISSQKTEAYYFQKRTLSLIGCSGIQIFNIEGLNISFLIAFRNNAVQLRKRSHNKVAILRINNYELNVDIDFFRNIMRHGGQECPTFNGCYNGSGTERIFKAALANERSDIYINCGSINIEATMTKSFDSEVDVTISTNQPPMTEQLLREETSCETCSNPLIEEAINEQSTQEPGIEESSEKVSRNRCLIS